MQADGLRVISFRHEQNAGYAASIAGFITRQARHLPHGVGPRLPQRPHGARQRDHQLLPDDPHQRLLGARDRRPAAGRLRGDGPARRRAAARQGGVPRPARRGHRRRRGARDPRRGLGPPGRRLPRPAGQAVPAGDRRRSGQAIADQGRRSGPAADPGAGRRGPRARPAQERQAAAHHPRQGRGLRAGRRRHPRARRAHRHPLPADGDGQGPAARHPRAIGVGGPLVRAAGGRRRDGHRRPPQLAAVARQGQDLGRRLPKAWGGQKFVQIDISPQEADSNVRIDAPVVGDIGSCVAAMLAAIDATGPVARAAGRVARRHRRAQDEERREDGRVAREEPDRR